MSPNAQPTIDAFRRELDEMRAHLAKPHVHSNNVFSMNHQAQEFVPQVHQDQQWNAPGNANVFSRTPSPCGPSGAQQWNAFASMPSQQPPVRPQHAPVQNDNIFAPPVAQLPAAPMPPDVPKPGPPPSYPPPQASQQPWHSHNDPWANWSTPGIDQSRRPPWKINRQNTEGLTMFDGNLAHYRNWCSRIRDHAAEDWAHWRTVLDHAARAPLELSQQYLQGQYLFGVNAWQLSSDLWSFLLK